MEGFPRNRLSPREWTNLGSVVIKKTLLEKAEMVASKSETTGHSIAQKNDKFGGQNSR